jgi:hypothetical protein
VGDGAGKSAAGTGRAGPQGVLAEARRAGGGARALQGAGAAARRVAPAIRGDMGLMEREWKRNLQRLDSPRFASYAALRRGILYERE